MLSEDLPLWTAKGVVGEGVSRCDWLAPQRSIGTGTGGPRDERRDLSFPGARHTCYGAFAWGIVLRDKLPAHKVAGGNCAVKGASASLANLQP